MLVQSKYPSTYALRLCEIAVGQRYSKTRLKWPMSLLPIWTNKQKLSFRESVAGPWRRLSSDQNSYEIWSHDPEKYVIICNKYIKYKNFQKFCLSYVKILLFSPDNDRRSSWVTPVTRSGLMKNDRNTLFSQPCAKYNDTLQHYFVQNRRQMMS